MFSKYDLLQSDPKRKWDSSSNSVPHKDVSSLHVPDKKLDINYANMRSRKSLQNRKTQNKSSDSEVISENELEKVQNSNLKPQQMQVDDEKNLLMKKFEYSLKQRLLSKAYFSKQVPLFDSITKEKSRIKTPIDNYESNNESVFTSVFPVRKKGGKYLNSSTMCEEVLTKHSKESEDWLKELEKDATTYANNEEYLNKSEDPVKKLSKSVHDKSKLKNNVDKDNNIHEALEKSKDLENNVTREKPRKHQEVDSRSSEKKIKKKKSLDRENSTVESNVSKSGDLKKQVLSRENSKRADSVFGDEANKIQEAHSVTENNLIVLKKKVKSKNSLVDNLKIKKDSKGKISSDVEVSKSQNMHLSDESSNNFNSTDRMDIIYIEKEISEKESVEIYGQERGGRVQGVSKRRPTVESSTSSNFTESTSKQFKNINTGGAQAEQHEMAQGDSYYVAYVETEREESTMEGGLDDTVSYVISTNESPELIKEDMSQTEKREDEENCVDEPCNEPSWFEDYGIDKKRRHEMGDTKLEKGSTSSSEVEEDLLESQPEAAEIIPEVKEEKKKVKKKVKQTEQIKMTPDVKKEDIEPKAHELKTIREIKTIPLVCIEDIGKEKDVEKTKQMPMEYLKEYIGKYLIAGLAKVALYMPKDPVEYLAHWLIKERKKETLIDELKKFKAEVKIIRQKNVADMKKKQQMDYLKEETLKLYNERKDDPLYPVFDSELELYQKSMDYAEQKMVGEDDENIPGLNYEEHTR